MHKVNRTKSHVYRTALRMMHKSPVRGGGSFTADEIHYEALMSPSLPSTLSLSTVRKYLNEFVSAEFPAIERVKYGRSVLYRIKKIDFHAMPPLKHKETTHV
jgi:hypothetical protein